MMAGELSWKRPFCWLLMLVLLLLLQSQENHHRVHAFVPHNNHNKVGRHHVAPRTNGPLFATTTTSSSKVRAGTVAKINNNVKVTPWQFQGHDVYAEVASLTTVNDPWKNPLSLLTASLASSSSNNNNNNKPTVLLIHGFGCSTVYWRATTATLVDAGYTVHAIDLLGQGQSAKPGRAAGVEYSIALWANQVEAYVQERMVGGNPKKSSKKNQKVVLMGNSLGSLVALVAATADGSVVRDCVAGIGMFNCGIGLNSRNIAKEPQWNAAQRFLINRVYDLATLLIFGNTWLLQYALENWVTRDALSQALQNLYPTAPERVDDALVDSFYLPAQEEGAVEALSQIYCNDAGDTPMQLHDRHTDFLNALPIHLVWGSVDVVTPVQGGLGVYYGLLAERQDTAVSMEIVTGGHIPFDEVPDVANDKMLTWLQDLSSSSSLR